MHFVCDGCIYLDIIDDALKSGNADHAMSMAFICVVAKVHESWTISVHDFANVSLKLRNAVE